jgi:hypothetical protein
MINMQARDELEILSSLDLEEGKRQLYRFEINSAPPLPNVIYSLEQKSKAPGLMSGKLGGIRDSYQYGSASEPISR